MATSVTEAWSRQITALDSRCRSSCDFVLARVTSYPQRFFPAVIGVSFFFYTYIEFLK